MRSYSAMICSAIELVHDHVEALDFATHPSRRDDCEGVDFYREQVENEEWLARLR